MFIVFGKRELIAPVTEKKAIFEIIEECRWDKKGREDPCPLLIVGAGETVLRSSVYGRGFGGKPKAGDVQYHTCCAKGVSASFWDRKLYGGSAS